MKGKAERIETISEFCKTRGLPAPLHPLITIVDYKSMDHYAEHQRLWSSSFYAISIKRDVIGKYRYGHSSYDFDEGLMNFIAPNQLLYTEMGDTATFKTPGGYLLFIHPDFLWNTSLAGKIGAYDFFGYAINEALFLSAKEEETVMLLFENLKTELQHNIDTYSKNIIISQLELLLNYGDRFYGRQFITRDKTNQDTFARFNSLLDHYINSEEPLLKGLPAVTALATQLNYSPVYLSKLLKHTTGLNAQQLIQEKLIDKAKSQLAETQLTVAEIAYGLGFEHPQSLSKLFKSKTNMSPLEFRQSCH